MNSTEGYAARPAVGAAVGPVAGDLGETRLAITSFTATPDSVLWQAGSVTLSVVTSGGALPLTYSYSGFPPGCESGNVPTISCESARTGTFTIRVNVTDSNGALASANTTFNVTPSIFGLSPDIFWAVFIGSTLAILGVAIFLAWRRVRRQEKFDEE